MSASDWQTTELFETLVQQDLADFVGDRSNLSNSVLLFPPVTDRYRFLIHKCVEATQFNLHSFSIGSGDNRQTVVCDSVLLVRDNRHNNESYLREEAQRLAEAARRRAVRKSELKRKAIQDMERNKKRPSQQVYVPAARRSNAGDPGNTSTSSSPKESVTSGLDSVKTKSVGRGRGRARPSAEIYVPGAMRKKNTAETDDKANSNPYTEYDSEKPPQTDNHGDSQVSKCQLREDNSDIDIIDSKDASSDPCALVKEQEQTTLGVYNSGSDETCEDSGRSIESESCVPEISTNESQVETADKVNLDVEADRHEEDVKFNSHIEPTNDTAAEERTENSNQSTSTATPEFADTDCKQDYTDVCGKPAVPLSGGDKTTNKKDKKQNVKHSKKLKEPIAKSVQSTSPVRQEKAELEITPIPDREEEPEEDSWDAKFDDDGDCLDEDAMKELERAVGKVKIKKPIIDYLEYSPKDPDLEDESKYGHLLEIYDFPATFKTADLTNVFKPTVCKDFDVKWVDDTHAIGIFGSILAAQDALLYQHPMLKIRPISQASRPTKVKAKQCPDYLLPSKERPATSAMTAHRLVSASLGISAPVAKEKRAKERQLLKEAKEKKRSDHTAKESAWDGTVTTSEEAPNSTSSVQTTKKKWNGSFGKCAMDDM